MMFRLKTHGRSEEELAEIETKYFNERFLEEEVTRIIKPIFGITVEVNKVVIPFDKEQKTRLRYARAFFYISDIKSAFNIAKRSAPENENPLP